MKANIKISLSKLTPFRVLALLRLVVEKLTEHVALFTDPAIKLVDMTAFADMLETAISAATHGSMESKMYRNALVEQAATMLNAQADYVRQVCQGDALMLGKSGYELCKQPERVGIPGIPSVTARFTDKSGWLIVRWPLIHGGRAYKVMQTDKDPELGASWTQVDVTTRGRYTAKNLVSAKPYWFAVITVGADGESDMSAPAMGKAI